MFHQSVSTGNFNFQQCNFKKKLAQIKTIEFWCRNMKRYSVSI